MLCDDHRIVREGFKQVLADDADIVVCAEASTGQEALSTIEQLMCVDNTQHHPGLHIVLLDIAMPDGDGLVVLQTLRVRFPQLPVLMLSTYPEKQYAVRCIQLGAAGYLNKSADPDDMLHAVRKVASGGRYVSEATADALARAIGSTKMRQAAPGEVKTGIAALSYREYQVFRLLVSGHTVSEIGAQLQLASNTVSTYRARILEKTSTRNDVELALLAQKDSMHPSHRPGNDLL